MRVIPGRGREAENNVVPEESAAFLGPSPLACVHELALTLLSLTSFPLTV